MATNKVEICGVNTSKLPVLTNEEKETLLTRIKEGDSAARERYIQGNLRLVLSVIRRFSNSNENPDESESKKDTGYDLDSDGYVKWSFPWSLTVNYSVNYSYGDFDKEKMDYRGRFTQNLSFSGRIQPTKGWNFTFSTSYVGPYKSYNFHIAVKSSLLQDLKYDKRSSYSNGVDWY